MILANQKEVRAARILVAVTFHFSEQRLPSLLQVLRAFTDYRVALMKVVIFTNAGGSRERAAISRLFRDSALRFEIKSVCDLQHPSELTRAHKDLIRDEFLGKRKQFTHFIHVEDDEQMEFENFSYFIAARAALAIHGLVPGFVRTELQAVTGTIVNTDNTAPNCLEGRTYARSGPFNFIALDNPYCGAFVLDQELAREYAASRSLDRLGSFGVSSWPLRERAAMGLTFESVPGHFSARSVIPVSRDTRSIARCAWLAHLPNNCAEDETTGLAKVPMSDLLGGTFDPDLADTHVRNAPAAARARIAGLQTFMEEVPEGFGEGSRDLVMGLAMGYKIEAVRPFVESLRTAGAYRGETVLFTKPDDTELSAYLRDRGVRVELFDTGARPAGNMYFQRWILYLDWLQARLHEGKSWRNILLTDTRDVTFQKPLFATPCAELEFHLESPTLRIGECVCNGGWIRNLFGEAALARFASGRITCSGTVTGKMRGILRYLAQMQILMLALPEGASMDYPGDQGIHNFLVHSGLLPEGRAMENFGRVATLHYVAPDEIHFNEAAALVNPDGTISEIAHQWDRHEPFAAAIAAKAKSRQSAADTFPRKALRRTRQWLWRLLRKD